MLIKESDILYSVCEMLTTMKVFFWRNNNIPVYDPIRQCHRALPKFARHGVPDIIAIRPREGRIVCLEIKKPKPEKTYQSKEQKQFEADVKAAGGEYFVIRSLEDLQNVAF